MKSFVSRWAAVSALVLLGACNMVGARQAASVPPVATTGPAQDYPVVLGEPFSIGALTYTPEDVLNYDAVGYASVSEIPDGRIWIAHKTLPLPSYAEVTDLDTGKTILVRVEQRGPMVNERIIEFSQGAAAQLGIAGSAATVRVRRVNPPEVERALLRSGSAAAQRMETPEPLLKVLRRKLEDNGAVQGKSPTAPPAPAVIPRPVASPDPDARPGPTPPPASTVAAPATAGEKFVVQVAAFSTSSRAASAARALDGFVTKPGQYWLLRLGPFPSRVEADAALKKAREAGYSDARIQTPD